MGNIMYAPWSDDVNNYAEKALLTSHNFSILDIKLSGKCNFNCCYCDSPDRNKLLHIPLNIIKDIIRVEKIKYVFICGLGEPTVVGQNYNALIKILGTCVESNAQCSIFTNLYWITDELIEYIKNGTLNILFKLDSFEPVEVAELYGISLEMAKTQLKNIQTITKFVKNNNGLVNIGASVVPTKLNYHRIMDIIKECLRMGVYPFLTDLEYSGNAMAEYDALCLKVDELNKLKSEISVLMGREYNSPLCPAVIFGVQINNEGKVTVDSHSGLSCEWFWANNPSPFEIGDIHTESFQAISKKILDFRKKKYSDFAKRISIKANCDSRVFGGCGGNISLLFERYKEIQNGANV